MYVCVCVHCVYVMRFIISICWHIRLLIDWEKTIFGCCIAGRILVHGATNLYTLLCVLIKHLLTLNICVATLMNLLQIPTNCPTWSRWSIRLIQIFVLSVEGSYF